MTFKQFVEAHGADLAPAAPRARREWIAAMTTRVGLLADMQLGAITGDDIAEVMKPIWLTTPPAATKRLAGIARVLRAARARGVIDAPGWSNAAGLQAVSFSGVMKLAGAHREKPSEAMSYSDIPAVHRRPGGRGAAHCHWAWRWIVQTAVRAEALGARWCEIDREALVWTIPAARMKGQTGKKQAHQVPLSAAMLDVLERAMPKRGPAPQPGDYIFPSYRHAAGCFDPGSALDLLRDLRPGTVTVHGFRSTFFGWTQETTDFSDRLANAALAHAVLGVQGRYDRSTLVERRRQLMQAWGQFCTTTDIPAANDAPAPEAMAEAA